MSHCLSPRHAAAAIGLCVLTLTASNGLAQSYSITAPPTLGGISSAANDINDAGIVVGWSERATGGKMRPTRWTNGQPVDLDPLDWWESGEAVAISNTGMVLSNQGTALSCFPPGVAVFGPMGAYNWRMNFQQLPGTGRDINDAGVVVGCADRPTGEIIPLQWTSTAPASIGPTTSNLADPLDLNNAGLAVGYTTQFEGGFPDGVNHACIFANGQITDLGSLPGHNRSHAQSINNRGVIVGDADNGSNPCSFLNTASIAVKWVGNSPSILPMPIGASSARAVDLNDFNEIIGMTDVNFEFAAVLWRNDQPTLLSALLPQNSGWMSLNEARAINNKGQIVGWGWKHTAQSVEQRGFIISPCWGNFDGLNGTTLQDLFGFLSSYFGTDSKADVDRSGAINTGDLHVFLASWFTGCP